MTKTEILEKLKTDLEVRGRSVETIKEYTTKVRQYQDYYGKSADEMGEAEIIRYLHYRLTEAKVHSNSVNFRQQCATVCLWCDARQSS